MMKNDDKNVCLVEQIKIFKQEVKVHKQDTATNSRFETIKGIKKEFQPNIPFCPLAH